jgi:hypothetical protein
MTTNDKSSQGDQTPTAFQTKLSTAATLANSARLGFDACTAQNSLQAPQATASTIPFTPVANGAPVRAQHAAYAVVMGESL